MFDNYSTHIHLNIKYISYIKYNCNDNSYTSKIFATIRETYPFVPTIYYSRTEWGCISEKRLWTLLRNKLQGDVIISICVNLRYWGSFLETGTTTTFAYSARRVKKIAFRNNAK